MSSEGPGDSAAQVSLTEKRNIERGIGVRRGGGGGSETEQVETDDQTVIPDRRHPHGMRVTTWGRSFTTTVADSKTRER